MPADGPLDPARFRQRQTIDDGPIDLGHLALLELPKQLLVAAVVLGHHHGTRGVLVQSMDDPRALLAADTGQVVTVEKEPVDQGAVLVPATGMDHQTGRFGDHQQIIVFMENGKFYLFRSQHADHRFRHRNFDLIRFPQAVGGFGRQTVDQDRGRLDQIFKPGTTQTGIVQGAGQKGIQPLLLMSGANRELMFFRLQNHCPKPQERCNRYGREKLTCEADRRQAG